MRHPGPALLMTLAVVAGCAPRDDGPATAAAQTPAEAPQVSPSPGSRGKIAADQVGKASPVPAFQGGGAGWGIAIRASGGLRHGVRLHWRDPLHDASGTVRYRPQATPGRHELEGTLYGDGGDRAMRITLQRGACSGTGGRTRPYAVEVAVDGMAPLRGCGDLALP